MCSSDLKISLKEFVYCTSVYGFEIILPSLNNMYPGMRLCPNPIYHPIQELNSCTNIILSLIRPSNLKAAIAPIL